jgi:hypothetical protein
MAIVVTRPESMAVWYAATASSSIEEAVRRMATSAVAAVPIVVAAPAVVLAPAVVADAPVVAAPAAVVVAASLLSLPQAAEDGHAADAQRAAAAHPEHGVLPLLGREVVRTLEDLGEQLPQPGQRLLVVHLRGARLSPELVVGEVHGRPFVSSRGGAASGVEAQLIGYLVGSTAASVVSKPGM